MNPRPDPSRLATPMTRTALIATDAYLKDPQAIVARSWELIRTETDVTGLSAELVPVALRLVQATGMPEIVGDLRASTGAVAAGRAALRAGAPVFCDSEMTAAGILG